LIKSKDIGLHTVRGVDFIELKMKDNKCN